MEIEMEKMWFHSSKYLNNEVAKDENSVAFKSIFQKSSVRRKFFRHFPFVVSIAATQYSGKIFDVFNIVEQKDKAAIMSTNKDKRIDL